ncbi:BTAD domain-containing putative transcriptional regulator [Micromonospora sp. DT44]|uniref:AfsR/SARP family transcriptional regulator n=1 Tax=Micromonospora sp. DT44 TaxID=3393439 RepID=UPI003CFB44AA
MIEIKLLGPLMVQRSGVDVTPSAPKLRRVLAALVLNANMLVSVDQLFEELWENRPPPSALTTMQTYIYQLRRRLDLGTEPPPEQPTEPILMTRVGGYELRLDDLQAVDVHRFDRLVTQGRAEMDGGELEKAAQTLGDALATWRGPALVDVTQGRRLSVWTTQLEERRKAALERRFSALLQLGHHHGVVDELGGAMHDYPTHEGFAGQLMLALHRCGRRPEALDVFRRIRRQLVEELGLEPSAAVQRLHQAILADDPQLIGLPRQRVTASVSRSVAPAQLPPGIPDFVGRDVRLKQVADLLRGGQSRTGASPVVEVHGPPGIGKSTFALQAAHQARARFPDGQFYVDMSGSASGDIRLDEVLTASLRSCGLPRDDLPTSVDELSRTFRTWTADRRVLMVVDDVIDSEWLQPLLPGGSGCAVVSTNRYRHYGLPGAHHISLPAMTMDEALTLLGNIAGEWRVEDEGEAVKALIRMCDMLPLAVRGVAARLASRPGWPASRLLDRVCRDESMLLDLTAGPSDLIGTVDVGYRSLPEPYRRALRIIVTEHWQRWGASELATLLGARVQDAEVLIENLVDMHLLEEVPSAHPRGHPPSARRPVEPRYTVPRLNALALRSIIGAEDDEDSSESSLPHSAAWYFRRPISPLSAHSA